MAKTVMPTLDIHRAPPRSSITTDHNESKAPIIRNTASPITIAPATSRMRGRSSANRCEGMFSGSVSATSTRASHGTAAPVSPAMRQNGADSPNRSTVIAEMIGPAMKSHTSIESIRPRFDSTSLGRAKMMTRRMVGMAMPVPTPMMARLPIRKVRL